jgi:predicted permease
VRALRRFLIRLSASAMRRQDEQRLKEEIEEHLALQTAENLRVGLSPAEARRQAVLKFGAVEALKEQYRDEQGLPLLEWLLHDVRYALRQLRKAPVFTVTAVLSLAVGIGANAAIFTLVDRVLLRSLPVSDPEELVFVTDQRVLNEPSPRFSYPFYAALKDNDSLHGVAAHFVMPLNAAMDERVARVRGELVSGNYFSVVGAGMQRGRPLTPDDDRIPGSHPVAVISDGFWQRSFGSDPSVIGRNVRVNDYTFTIIGIAARGFAGTEVGLPTDIWLPMTMQKEIGRDLLADARTNWLEIIGRLKPGVSLEHAGAAMAGRVQGRRLMLLPAAKGNSRVRRDLGPALKVFMALTALALVLACVTVAGLIVVRSVAREKEIAVRLALGARRSSLIRQFLTETLVLAALGGTAGLLLAPWTAGLLAASQPGLRDIDSSLDVRVFLFGLAACVLTGLVIGLAPVLASSKVGVLQVSRKWWTTPGTQTRVTIRDVIVTCQLAVSLIMLIAAGLFVQTLRTLTSVDPGFRADDLLLISAHPAAAGYEGRRLQAFWRDTLDLVSQVPGVQSASLAGTVPLAPGRQRQPVVSPTSGESIEIDMNFVGPDYFRTLGIPLLRGREFNRRDATTSRPVVIVNERMARLLWPDEDPIGKALRSSRPAAQWPEIVGVVKDVKYRDLRDDAGPMFYVPVFQTTSSDPMTLHVWASSDPGELAGTIRREVQTVDTNVPLFGITTLEDQLDASFAQTRQAAVLTSGFGFLSLLLSAIGVYGVTALAVGRQTHEIGIRLALGARRGQIVHMIGRRGLTLVIAGLILGTLGSFGFTRIAGALLYGIGASDPTTFTGMAALLAAVSLIAIYIPTRAATRLDPVAAIRYE